MHLLMSFSILACFLAFLPTTLLAAGTPDLVENAWEQMPKDAFIDQLVSQMSVSDMVLQLYQLFGDDVIGPKSENELYDQALLPAPGSPIGVIHDWYPLNISRYNELQKLNLDKSHLKVPFIHMGECLHGVGSFQQSMFPQALGMACSFDTELVHRVASAIGTEARSIGVHACFAPVFDICQDPRWGRCQEAWGEDYILTSHMGVAFTSGLSQNSSWERDDAVVPVMKHFAAHGAPQKGLNGAPFMGHGNREVMDRLLVPFKAAVDKGGVRGVMMSYNELDDVPAHVNPMLYKTLEDWNFRGFTLADDTGDYFFHTIMMTDRADTLGMAGMRQLESQHRVASSPADAIAQWFKAGGMISFYDYPLDIYHNSTVSLVNNGSVQISILQHKVKEILGVKYDLGLFQNPYVPDPIDPYQIVKQHVPLTLEAARKSIVLLENQNSTLPLSLSGTPKKLALIGPFSDALNYGDYSGTLGAYPVANSTTILQGIRQSINAANSTMDIVSSWGANTWLFNAQVPIPGYHLGVNGTNGGLHATYYADTNFTQPLVQRMEVPVRDWGLYPPPGLPSNNFSATWEGTLTVPVDIETDGWLGIGISWNSTAKLYVDGSLHVDAPLTTAGNLLSNIPSREYSLVNSTAPPPGSAPFTFRPGATHSIRLEFQSYNLFQKIANQNSLNAQVLLFWNLVDRNNPIEKAVTVAQDADVIVLAVGANWNSDGEGGDRGTLTLPANQTELTESILSLNKPVIMVLEGGRPFAIPEFYNRSAAVLNTYFGGQSGGQAIADVLFGAYSPGGRLPLTIPRSVGQLPVFYNYKPTVEKAYVDIDSSPLYPFGYGLSYTNFTTSGFAATTMRSDQTISTANDTIVFQVNVKNTGSSSGSFVPQVYLLGRVSQITQPVRQLVAFSRVYLEPGEEIIAHMEVEVDRYLKILNRQYEWEVEAGEYVFALMENGGSLASTDVNVTMTCI